MISQILISRPRMGSRICISGKGYRQSTLPETMLSKLQFCGAQVWLSMFVDHLSPFRQDISDLSLSTNMSILEPWGWVIWTILPAKNHWKCWIKYVFKYLLEIILPLGKKLAGQNPSDGRNPVCSWKPKLLLLWGYLL